MEMGHPRRSGWRAGDLRQIRGRILRDWRRAGRTAGAFQTARIDPQPAGVDDRCAGRAPGRSLDRVWQVCVRLVRWRFERAFYP